MSNHIENPAWKKHQSLNFTDAEWDALKAKVQAVLDANSAKSSVPVALLREVDDALAVSPENDPKRMTDRNWNQLAADMGLGPEFPEPRA